ncbi:ABC transporter permease [Mycoplasma yeatsii]|uniref:ABC transport system permease protein n=1 Tax=Mycoplasma yeatsii TaxID=51365 RepID=A0ABU0NFD5_9MOLU|nr:ABC transporter permease [Mycoplasma yeatsii]MDQ0568084.1 putative ABC transport system permease protein [Mycoplasma yeatsii]
MKNIIKSYLKTFFQKNFVTTFGILFFIIMLSTVILGMLSTPLQLNSRINKLSKTNISYNSLIRSENMTYSPEFTYNYFYLNEQLKDEDRDDEIKNVLSDRYIEAINSEIEQNFDKKDLPERNNNRYILDLTSEKDIIIANYISDLINSDLQKYRSGALLKSTAFIENADERTNFNLKNVVNEIAKRLLRNFVKNNVFNKLGIKFDENNKLIIPETLDLNSFKPENKDLNFLVSEAYRSYSKIDDLFLINGIKSIDKNQIRNDILEIRKLINERRISQLFSYIQQKFKEISQNINESKKEVYLPTFDMFSEQYENKILSVNDHDDRIYLINKIISKHSDEYSVQTTKSFTLNEQQVGQLLPMKTLQLTSDIEEFKNNNSNKYFNQVQLDEKNYSGSRFAEKWNEDIDYSKTTIPEIVISSAFAKANNINLNSTFSIPSSNKADLFLQLINKKDAFYLSSVDAKVVGIGSTFDDISSKNTAFDFFQEKPTFVTGYANDNFINQMRESRWNFSTEKDSSYEVLFKIKNLNNNKSLTAEECFKEIIFKSNSNEEIKTTFFDKSFSPYVEWTFSRVAKDINSIRVQVIIYMVLGVTVLILAFIFINFALRKEMNETRRQLGIFKSFGYKVIELSWIFALKTWITIFLGIFLGYLLSIPIQLRLASNFVSSVTFVFSKVYVSPTLFINLFALIPLLFLFLSYALTILYIREPVLSLMNNAKRIKRKIKSGWFSDMLSKRNIGFNYRMRLSFIKTSAGKFAIVQCLFVFASLSYSLLFGAQTILTQSINQGLAEIKSSVDHRWTWKNNRDIDITSKDGKYDFSKNNSDNREQLKYRDLDNKTVNEWLKSQYDQSDVRYRVELLFRLLNNTYKSEGKDKLSILLPLEYAQKRLSPFLQNNEKKLNPEKDNEPVLKNKKYFLNVLSTFNLFNKNEKWKSLLRLIKANGNIDEKLIDFKDDENIFFNFDEPNLENMSKTFVGLESMQDKKHNSLFLSSISKTFSYKLAQTYALFKVFYNYKIDKNTPDNEKNIQKYWDEVNEKDELLKQFDPDDQKYWTIGSNPLVKEIQEIVKQQPGLLPISVNSLIGSNNLSNASQNVMFMSLILDKLQENYSNNPVLTFNQLLYDKNTDLLASSVLAKFVEDSGLLRLNLFEMNNKRFADIRKFLNFEGITDEQFKEVSDQNLEYIDPQTGEKIPMFNTIVPYYYAKSNGYGIDSKIKLETKTSIARKFVLNIVGINKSITLSLSKVPDLVLDYKVFASKMFAETLYDRGADTPKHFTTLWSTHKLLDGEFDLQNIEDSFNSFKYKERNISLDIKDKTPVFLSLFSSMFDEFNDFISFYRNVDTQIDVYNTSNPTPGKNSRLNSKLLSYNLGKQGIEKVLKIMYRIMAIFIVLTTFLLVIILVVIMNIVVGESKKTILVLRAIGYKDFEVNWIVMGSYVIGAFISFILAYSLSNAIWLSFLYYVSYKWHIYIFLPFEVQYLFITFFIIAFILFIGWFFSNQQVKKTPLTQATQAE